MAQRILVVDDDPGALRLISYALHRDGFEVLVAQSGAQALEMAGQEHIDLVVLDVMMPHMDGLEVCRRLRESSTTARLPIIMLTAKAQIEDKVQGFKSGADDYITKPVLPAELVARIRALLARSGYLTPAKSKSSAKVISFLGAKGGVGVTTLAVNVGVTLAERGKSTILIDLNLSSGAAALQLGMRPPSGFLDLLHADGAQPLPRIASALLTHTSGLKVFPAPSRSDVPKISVSAKRMGSIVDEFKAQADYLILDVGASLNGTATAGLSRSDRIIVVTESDHVALDLVQDTLAALTQLNAAGALIEVVMVNCTRSATVISKAEAEQRLNTKLISFIIPAPEMCFQSNRSRVPIVISQPGNLTVEQIRELAEHISH